VEGEPVIPLAADGHATIGVVFGAAALAWAASATLSPGPVATSLGWLAWGLILAGLFFVNFFRDPRRTPPSGDQLLVSPADGKILFVEPEVDEPRFLRGRAAMVSIFMSPLDVHVNRAPLDGDIEAVHYNPGEYFAAYSDKASLENEQNAIVLRAADGRRILFIQIAGFLARRIVCRVRPGDRVRRGERVGMIKLGSRVDVWIPGAVRLRVAAGDRVRAGETVLGELA